jgi:chromosome segregation ATPase
MDSIHKLENAMQDAKTEFRELVINIHDLRCEVSTLTETVNVLRREKKDLENELAGSRYQVHKLTDENMLLIGQLEGSHSTPVVFQTVTTPVAFGRCSSPAMESPAPKIGSGSYDAPPQSRDGTAKEEEDEVGESANELEEDSNEIIAKIQQRDAEIYALRVERERSSDPSAIRALNQRIRTKRTKRQRLLQMIKNI